MVHITRGKHSSPSTLVPHVFSVLNSSLNLALSSVMRLVLNAALEFGFVFALQPAAAFLCKTCPPYEERAEEREGASAPLRARCALTEAGRPPWRHPAASQHGPRCCHCSNSLAPSPAQRQPPQKCDSWGFLPALL